MPWLLVCSGHVKVMVFLEQDKKAQEPCALYSEWSASQFKLIVILNFALEPTTDTKVVECIIKINTNCIF